MAESTESNKPDSPDELRKLVRRVTSTFAVTPERSVFSPLEEVMTRVSKPLAEIGAAFRANVAGLISTITMPFALADRSMLDRHWQRFLSVARIRSLMTTAQIPGADLAETHEQFELRRNEYALANARIEMEKFLKSSENTDLKIKDTMEFLDTFLSNKELVGAANELILQGAVLCWGAFEVMARDCFIVHLNANPASSLSLIEDPGAKRRFDLSKVSLETLAVHNFDLSERMGTLLAKQQDLSDVNSIKAVYQALFPGQSPLFDALNDSDLRILSLRRNLIVHRCGVIDGQYVSSANCTRPVGERLRLSPLELEAHLYTTVKVTSVILDAVSAT